MTSFEELCDLITKVVESDYPYRTDSYEDKLATLSEYIKQEHWGASDFLELSDKAFAGDPQLYSLVLSAMYWATEDIEYLLKVEEILLTGAFDSYITSYLQFQIYHQRFLKNRLSDYVARRTLQRYISHKFIKELNVNINMIQYEKRNHKFVVLTTYQLLSDKHAPSKLVLSVCWHLQRDFGYEVLLLVIGEPVDSNRLSNYWTGDIVGPNYIDRWGKCVVDFHDERINYYQIDINNSTRDELLSFIGEVYDMRPEFIWQINGLPKMDHIWKNMTTYISMPVLQGYDISDANLLVRYQAGDIPPEVEEFIRLNGQESLYFKLATFPAKETLMEDEYTKRHFGIVENSFTIGIIGTRLEREVTEEFKDVLERIVKNDDGVTFVFIGNISKSLGEVVDSHSVRLGYRDDFRSVLKIIDLFVNPKRAGASGGATKAMRIGIPIVTLPDCDVAGFCGPDFICSSYDEMIDTVHRYVTDRDYYESQRETGLEHFKTLFSSNVAEDMKLVIDKAIEIGKKQ